MKFFNLNFSTLVLRFYLLMGIVIGAFFSGIPWLAILALPVFLISMMGIEFKRKTNHLTIARPSRVHENVGMHQAAH